MTDPKTLTALTMIEQTFVVATPPERAEMLRDLRKLVHRLELRNRDALGMEDSGSDDPFDNMPV